MKENANSVGGVDAGRIARNAGWLYARLAVVTLSGLISVRVVMNAFGVAGFGLYTAVAGAVSLVFFLQWTMELSVRRFLCVEIGKGDGEGLRNAFSGGLLLAVVLCLVFVLAGETLGRWFVLRRMAFPAELSGCVVFVLHASVVFQALETLRLPFEALIVASERMSFFAKISIAEALLSLAAAGAAAFAGRRGIEVYAGALAVKSLVVLLLCRLYCARRFADLVRLRRPDRRMFLAEGAFFLKSLLSDVANMLKNQGVNMLVNVYAGVAYNASWSASMRVGSSLYGLVANFQQAFFPQIVKLWTHDDKRPFVVLMAGTLRWAMVITGACVLPLLVLTGPVLVLWLGAELPPEAVAFTQCVAIHTFFDALIGPLHTAIVATGKVLRFNVCLSIVMGSGFFLAWACLARGFPAWSSVASVAAVNILAFLYRLHYVRRHLGIAVIPFLRKVFLPMKIL